MPKRSNAFQKLILHIHRTLAGDATVTESELLADHRHGGTREVDVVLRSTVAGHSIIVSVEATSAARPADVEWVEQMLKKHESLPTNRLVLVSESGFTERALTVANAGAASALSIAEAEVLDWTQIVAKESSLEYQRFDFDPRAAYAIVVSEGVERRVPLEPATMLLEASGEKGELAGPVVRRALTDPRFGPAAMQRATEESAELGALEFSTVPPLFVRDPEGAVMPVDRIHVDYAVRRLTATVPLRHGAWSGTPVAFGSAKTTHGTVSLTVVESRESGPSVTITSPNPYTGKDETQPTMRVARDEPQ